MLKARASTQLEWYNAKGYSGTLHDCQNAYFSSLSDLTSGTTYDYIRDALEDGGYDGTLFDKMNEFMSDETGLAEGDGERQFYQNSGNDFPGGGGATNFQFEDGTNFQFEDGTNFDLEQ